MGKKVLKDNKIAKQRKREEARRKASRSRRIDLVIKYGPVFGTLVLAIVLGVQISNGSLTMGSAPYRAISLPEDLKSAFFSGNPALILCADSAGANDAASQGLNTAFLGAAQRLLTRDVESIVIDCSAQLPSGKTTYERLKLNSSAAPVLFHVQGGDKPYQLSPGLLVADKGSSNRKGKGKKKGGAESAAKDDEVGLKLARAVLERVRKRFSLAKVKSTKVLQDACVKRRSCVLFVGRGDRLFQDNKKAKSLLEGLVKKYRTLRWAYLDISQYMFSMKSQLPADLVSGKVGKKMPLSAVGFRRGPDDKIVFSPVDGLISSQLDADLFIVDLLSSEDLKEIPKLPSLRKRPTSSQPQTASSTSSSQGNVQPETTQEEGDTKDKVSPEELERRRRQRMEEEAEEFLAQEVAEEDMDDTLDDFPEEDDYIVLD